MKVCATVLAIFTLALGASASAKAGRKPASFEGQERVSEDCEAFLFAKADKALPAHEFVSRMRLKTGSTTDVDLELTKDMGQENFCLKSGTAKIKDDGNGVCEVIHFNLNLKLNYDCG